MTVEIQVPTEALSYVRQLHAVVDEVVASLITQHPGRLQCRLGCVGCCRDDLTVLAVEAAVITAAHGDLLRTQPAHPVGACAFLDSQGACRIYADRPYVCRTQGLPLRWLELDETTDEVFEYRDICELNQDGGPPIEALPAAACWSIGPFEDRLAGLQDHVDQGTRAGEASPRVALRALFSEGG